MPTFEYDPGSLGRMTYPEAVVHMERFDSANTLTHRPLVKKLGQIFLELADSHSLQRTHDWRAPYPAHLVGEGPAGTNAVLKFSALPPSVSVERETGTAILSVKYHSPFAPEETKWVFEGSQRLYIAVAEPDFVEPSTTKMNLTDPGFAKWVFAEVFPRVNQLMKINP